MVENCSTARLPARPAPIPRAPPCAAALAPGAAPRRLPAHGLRLKGCDSRAVSGSALRGLRPGRSSWPWRAALPN